MKLLYQSEIKYTNKSNNKSKKATKTDFIKITKKYSLMRNNSIKRKCLIKIWKENVCTAQKKCSF